MLSRLLKLLVVIGISVSFCACIPTAKDLESVDESENNSGTLDPIGSNQILFAEDFESVLDLGDFSNQSWNNIRNSHPLVNSISLNQDISDQYVFFTSSPQPGSTSKAHLQKYTVNEQSIPRESLIEISFDIKVDSGCDLDKLYFLDVECRDCWPTDSPHENQQPGIRFKYIDNNNVSLDRSKIGLSDLNNNISMPAGTLKFDQWQNYKVQISLSEDETLGEASIQIDDTLVFQTTKGVTIAKNSIMEPLLGDPLNHVDIDRVDFGITANVSLSTCSMSGDNFKIELLQNEN